MTLEHQAAHVRTKEDLARWMEALAEDRRASPERWANADLATLLAASSAWLHDCDGYYAARNEDVDRLPVWRVLADVSGAERAALHREGGGAPFIAELEAWPDVALELPELLDRDVERLVWSDDDLRALAGTPEDPSAAYVHVARNDREAVPSHRRPSAAPLTRLGRVSASPVANELLRRLDQPTIDHEVRAGDVARAR